MKALITITIAFVFAAVYFYFNAARPKNVKLAYYYWNSKFELNVRQNAMLAQSNAPLYLHVFDVDAPDGKRLIPLAELSNFTATDVRKIIPVIYLTQKGLNGLRETDIDTLSKRMIIKAENVTGQTRQKWHELQIDCDWTESNQRKYFALLRSIKKELSSVSLSATIRLHQIKFLEKTGVPPVDRGMLMFYNAGNIKTLKTENSIYSSTNMMPYLDRIDAYPLPLDYALPAFTWGLLYRMGRIQQILDENQLTSILKSGMFTRLNPHLYTVNTSGFLDGVYFFEGDQIKIEQIDAKVCEESAVQLASCVKNNNFTLCFFQLGSPTLLKYSNAEIKKILAAFN